MLSFRSRILAYCSRVRCCSKKLSRYSYITPIKSDIDDPGLCFSVLACSDLQVLLRVGPAFPQHQECCRSILMIFTLHRYPCKWKPGWRSNLGLCSVIQGSVTVLRSVTYYHWLSIHSTNTCIHPYNLNPDIILATNQTPCWWIDDAIDLVAFPRWCHLAFIPSHDAFRELRGCPLSIGGHPFMYILRRLTDHQDRLGSSTSSTLSLNVFLNYYGTTWMTKIPTIHTSRLQVPWNVHH